MSIKKPLVLELDGIIGQLADGGIINSGGTSSPTFTVGGRGLLFDDGSSTAPGGPTGVNLQNVFDNSQPAANGGLLRLSGLKNLVITNDTGDYVFFELDSYTGNLTLIGDLTLGGKINDVNVQLLKSDFYKHIAGDAGYRHLALDIDIIPISGFPAGISNVQEALEHIASNLSTDSSNIFNEINAIEASVGPALNENGTFNQNAFQDVTGILVDPTSITNAIQQIANYVGSFSQTLDDLTDVTIGLPKIDGQVLRYNGAIWVNQKLSINDLARDEFINLATGDIILFDGTKFTNKALGQASGIQKYDPALDAIATGGTGIVVLDGNTVAFRTLVAPQSGLQITNTNGVAGNITFSLTGELAALSSLSTTGFLARPADDQIVSRSVEGTNGRIAVTDGDGISGNPKIDLAQVSNPATAGAFLKITTDIFGRVVNTLPVQATDITALVDSAYVNATGDSISGTLTMTNGSTITGLPMPVNATDAASKEYVDSRLVGLSWKDAVRATTTQNINLSTDVKNGSILDGVTLVTGDRILIKDQTVKSQNGIYIVQATGSPIRSADLNDAREFDGAAVFVKEGTKNETTGWTQSKTVNTVDTDDVVWSQFVANAATDGTGINLGSPLSGTTTGAVSLTSSTSLSDSIAQLNNILGKLVPTAPTSFPAGQTLAVQSLSSYRMTDFVQTDNTAVKNKSVAGGTVVSSVRRAAAYTTNTIANSGPGDSGAVTVYVNGVAAGSVTLTSSLNKNGTYNNLVITNNYDYNNANSAILPGFWSVFSASATGSVSAGWNEVYINHNTTASTNTPNWYYDSSNPGTPTFTSASITPPASPEILYSSTVPHYTSNNQFSIAFNVNRLSGDMYPISDTFMTGAARGAFQSPTSRTYAQAGVTTPLARNLYVASGSQAVSTVANVVSGFGSSSQGPTVSVNNSYATGSQNIDPTGTVLYKTGTSNALEELNIQVGSSIGSGTTAVARIVNPGSTDTPPISVNATLFNSTSGPLQTYDATIVAGVLRHDQTNYSSGYLPVGPNLSSGRSGNQYFTFKIVRSSVSKFDIRWSGTIAGLWVAVPGTSISSTSTLNGWLDASVAYGGSGIPGANLGAGGNGSNGCALGSVAPLNSAQSNTSITITLGTVSSSLSATNEIYVRIKLTAGQTVTALSLQTASN